MSYELSKKIILEQIQQYIDTYKEYAWFKVPENIYDLTEITLRETKGITTFAPFQEFKNLKSVLFGRLGSTASIDLEGIEFAANLESLTFMSKTKIIGHVDSIAKLSNLNRLGLYNTLTPLPAELIANLSKLESISLSKEIYQSIKTLPENLIEICLNFDSIAELPAWNTVAKVERVSAGLNTCKFENLDSFKCFPNITEIKLNAPKALKDISYVSKLEQLIFLELNFAGIEDFTVLANRPNLESLKLRGTKLENISDLYPNKKLKILYLEKTKIKSIEGIKEQFPLLELLWIWDTKVKDLSPLTGMESLKNLDITMLKPTSWDFIKTLKGLEILDLCKSSFSDINLLSDLDNLKYVRLDGTNVDQNTEECKKLMEAIQNRADKKRGDVI